MHEVKHSVMETPTMNLEHNLPMPMVYYGVQRDLSYSIPKEHPSRHEMYELSFLLSGKLEFFISGAYKDYTEQLSAGGAIIIKPSYAHRVKALADRCETITIYFKFQKPGSMADHPRYNQENLEDFMSYALKRSEPVEGMALKPFIKFYGGKKDLIGSIARSILNEMDKKDYGHELMTQTLTTQLMIHAARAIHAEWEQLVRVQEGKSHNVIAQARSYIHAHFSEPITDEDVASFVFLSTGYFSRLFNEEMGQTPQQYITRLRVEFAEKLLSSTSMRVSDVAEQAGFGSTKRFNLAFRRFMGLTPSEYRRNKSAVD